MSRASFVLSAPQVTGLPQHGRPEVALLGRSNVGKSSLLATLLESNKLVRTSRTPGRTQLLNLFFLGDSLALVDLPGYGYAKLSLTQRAQMQAMIRGYVAERSCLNGCLLLLDARRDEVSAADREMGALVLSHGRPLLVVLTKADLVPKNTLLSRRRALEKSFGVPDGFSVVVSSKTGLGQEELRQRITELLNA